MTRVGWRRWGYWCLGGALTFAACEGPAGKDGKDGQPGVALSSAGDSTDEGGGGGTAVGEGGGAVVAAGAASDGGSGEPAAASCGALEQSCCPGFACSAGLACIGGACVEPSITDYGKTCNVDAECLGGLCAATAGEGQHCSSACSSDVDCPAGWSCSDLSPSGVLGCQCAKAAEICNGLDDDCDGEVDGQQARDASCADLGDGALCHAGRCECAGIECGTWCVDAQTDRFNCGDCGVTCELACVGGACVVPTALAVGEELACAILSDKSLRCWGRDQVLLDAGVTLDPGQPRALPIADVEQVALSVTSACAVDGAGVLRCWGRNNFGSLGMGDQTPRPKPTRVPGLANVTSVARSDKHACATVQAGGVWCWGSNSVGQLGVEPVAARQKRELSPVEVPGLGGKAIQLALGAVHSCALLEGGAVSCWGQDTLGQLGDGKNVARSTPDAVSGLTDAIEIVAGADHTCARHADGTVSCWGDNSAGQLGDDRNEPSRNLAVSVSGLSDLLGLGATSAGTLAASGIAGDAVQAWGVLPGLPAASTPISLLDLGEAVKVAGGVDSLCALSKSGGIKCLGMPEESVRWR